MYRSAKEPGFAVATLILAAIMSWPAHAANALTCAVYKEKLASKIHEDGDRSAIPYGYHVVTEMNGGASYAFGGGAGIEGFLYCKSADVLDSVTYSADYLAPPDSEERILRIQRVSALATAALCAIDSSSTLTGCGAAIREMLDGAARELFLAKRRGELAPVGDIRRHFSNGEVLVEVSAGNEGTVEMSIFAPGAAP
jgi:hypothetical protein